MSVALGMCLLFASMAGASRPQAPESPRMDALWEAVSDRISTQTDIWYEGGDFPKCVELLRMQANLFPQDYEIVTNLGWMQENLERWDDAVTTYERFRADNPEDPDGSLPEAEYYFRKKEYAKVIPLMEPVVATHKGHPNNYRILAHSYARLNRLEDSLKIWKLYTELAPDDLTAKKNMAGVEKKIADQKAQ